MGILPFPGLCEQLSFAAKGDKKQEIVNSAFSSQIQLGVATRIISSAA
jgi:hypothetical protein